MIMINVFETSYNGIETINNIDYKFGVSIGNKTGATEYGLRFYVYPDAGSDEVVRLSAKRGEYELVNVYEDCEVGSVEFRIGNSFYCLNFTHDGKEPFIATFNKIAKPEGWSYEQVVIETRNDVDEITATAFVNDRINYFKSIHDTFADAMTAFEQHLISFCSGYDQPSLWMA